MEAREQEFLDYVQSGGLVETDDWMPDEYRKRLIKFIEMHGNSELMGVLPERDWILRAPTLQRKLALTAKIQDEVGHCQLIYRVVEDLGKPRSACLDDLISGKSKFHNVFHYPTKSWGDVGVIAWLVDAAAIISQKALLKCSYAPYARVMKKVCWEESFHILHGRDTILAMVTGTPEQRELVQEALNRWWEPLMHFHGTPIPADEDPMVTLADQEPGQRGGAPAVPRGLRAADPRARPRDPRPEAAPQRRGGLGVHRARLGQAARRRHRPRAGVAGAARLPPPLPRRDGLGLEGGARGGRMIWEVFRQERKGQPFTHGGSFHAPDQAFADAYAREFYARRQESVALWVVPRDAIHAIEEFPDEFDLKYRRVDGYSIKARLKEARARVGSTERADAEMPALPASERE